ncbi:MAG TPA: response regulator transcription factor [Verrucomicrobiae bacterium]|nr:response regulator transcription factor [Verrucomicrobiae bacterium]
MGYCKFPDSAGEYVFELVNLSDTNIKSASAEQHSGDALIPVAVVEDNPTVRRNLERWLNRAAGFRCVCSCSDGEEALRSLPGHQPKVVLMDIQMPKMSGVDCAARLKAILPETQIIMLTVYEDTDTIFKALRAGASGYLLKRCIHGEIVHPIREILQGGAPMSSAIARKVVAAFHEPVKPEKAHVVLSAREREILDLLAEGLSNKEIAAKLNVSPYTIKNHLAKVFEKLHVRSRTEAVMAYLRPIK